jgi:hypothetical protein
MARTVRDMSLETRAARARLKPYYRLIDQGCHLGYRVQTVRRYRPVRPGACTKAPGAPVEPRCCLIAGPSA